jgi:hypothetical protein
LATGASALPQSRPLRADHPQRHREQAASDHLGDGRRSRDSDRIDVQRRAGTCVVAPSRNLVTETHGKDARRQMPPPSLRVSLPLRRRQGRRPAAVGNLN